MRTLDFTPVYPVNAPPGMCYWGATFGSLTFGINCDDMMQVREYTATVQRMTNWPVQSVTSTIGVYPTYDDADAACLEFLQAAAV